MLEKQLSSIERSRNIPKLRFPEFESVWGTNILNNLCLIKGRIGYKGYTKQDLVKKGEGALTIGAKHINKFNQLDFSDPEYISWFKYDESPEIKVDIGDVLFVQRGSLGATAIVRELKEPATINPSMVLLKDFKCLNLFLYYQLIGSKFQKLVSQVSTSTAVPMISQRDLGSLQINIPSLPEQQKIASFLTDVDDKITKLTKKKDLLEQYKKGIMQKIFNQELRFKDDNGNAFPKWSKNKIGNVFNSLKGKGIPKGDVISGGVNKCVLYGELYTTYKEVINKVESSTNSEDGLKSLKGDLLIPSSTTTTGIDLANVTALNFDNVLLGGDIIVMRGKKEINNIFYAYYLSNFKKHQIASRAQGITIVHIYFNSIKDLEIDVPVVEEQTKIANFLSDIDEKIEALATKIERNKAFKKGLLQKMFV